MNSCSFSDISELNAKYMALDQYNNYQVMYIWIDATQENMRGKTKTFDFEPKTPSGKLIIRILESNFVYQQISQSGISMELRPVNHLAKALMCTSDQSHYTVIRLDRGQTKSPFVKH